jgi:hypothetical protein
MFDTRDFAFQGEGAAHIGRRKLQAKSVAVTASDLTRLMTTGGDARIALDSGTGLNRYFSAPRPSTALAYASSTSNDISAEAFAHVAALPAAMDLDGQAYAGRLEILRTRIRRAYGLTRDIDIIFSPSGTDLEYAGLACAAGRGPAGTHNILLGADEVGSGCIHSAHGRYFAAETALGIATRPGVAVPGLGETHVEMIDVPVRDAHGRARPSADIAARMDAAIRSAQAQARHVLVHVVHGSKTGLILPALSDIDRLRDAHGSAVTFLIDACQARITSPAIAHYLAREAIVFVTGSKFMGGPPFSGFALVPRRFREEARPLAAGLATIFRRGEWPSEWPGADALQDSANPGLLLRLEASIFELERFQRLALYEVAGIILCFHQAVREEIIERTRAHRVAPYPPGEKETADTHPIEMRTLSTLDLSEYAGGGATFEDATRWHKAMIAHGVRLGQPVKCVKLADGSWGATLRIGLSMPIVVERSGMDQDALRQSFARDMAKVRAALEAVAT